ncbi:protein TIFY 6a-like [Typha angustifolia]|uniref:protein TIFY 6a-like n=1 Tax=Typha angustifolia TaxID=59011 RepID=UPI003C2B7AF3
MEMDFLGINGKDGYDGRVSMQEAALFGGSGHRAPPQQPFLSFKMPPEDKAKNLAVDHLFSSRFRPLLSTMDAFDKSSPVLAPQSLQKSLGLDRQEQIIQQYAMRAYQSQCTDSFGSSPNGARIFPTVSRHPLPIASRRPFFDVAMASSMQQQPFGGGIALHTAPFAQRDATKPSSATAQLTVFYAGAVNVFDDIPMNKAQEIMLLANKASSKTSNAGSSRNTPLQSPSKMAGSNDSNANQTISQKQNSAPCSGLSSPISVASLRGTHSRSASITSDDSAGPKSAGPLAPTNQYFDPPNTYTCPVGATMPRAVPQARKASLTRFLEKRKERVMTNAMPYSCENKTLGISINKSSLKNIASSSNGDELAHSRESPSTRLEI